MKTRSTMVILATIVLASPSSFIQCTNSSGNKASPTTITSKSDDPISANAKRMLGEGKQTFRFETFGDEAYWADALQLNKAIAGEKNGGVGAGLSPKAALAAG